MPDTEIFGARAAFKPPRLFKLARSKAYLFAGVEIRWSCDPSLLKGLDDVPAEASSSSPAALPIISPSRSATRELVTPSSSPAVRPWPARTGPVEWAVAWPPWPTVPVVVLQHHPDARWRHP